MQILFPYATKTVFGLFCSSLIAHLAIYEYLHVLESRLIECAVLLVQISINETGEVMIISIPTGERASGWYVVTSKI
jgi:hypothetical protein